MKIEKLEKNQLIEYKDDIRECLLQLDSIHDELTANKILNNINQYLEDGTAIIICAIEENHIIGLIWAYEKKESFDKRYHINYFVVDKNYRGKGIGHKLIGEIFNIAKKNNIENIELLVNSNNKNAIKFYENQDFIVKKYYLTKNID